MESARVPEMDTSLRETPVPVATAEMCHRKCAHHGGQGALVPPRGDPARAPLLMYFLSSSVLLLF